MKHVIISMALLLSFVGVVSAQDTIPNAGFEHWTLGNPDHWTMNNAANVLTPITKSSRRPWQVFTLSWGHGATSRDYLGISSDCVSCSSLSQLIMDL